MFRVLIALFVLILPGSLFAHSTGVSIEKRVGDYVIDVAYDTPQPVAGDRLVFDFALWDTASTSVQFDYVWVRIEHEKKTLLATGIAESEFGPTSLLYAIPEDVVGDLLVRVRYQTGNEALAESEFTIPASVPPRTAADFLVPVVSAIVGAVVSAGATFFFIRRKSPMV